MTIKKSTYNVMEGEPQLGKVNEYELIAEVNEVQDWILDQVKSNFCIERKYDFEDGANTYEIVSSDYIDVDMVEIYLEHLEEDCEDIDDGKLYAYAAVDPH